MEVKIQDAHCEITMQHLEFGAIIGGRRLSPHSILKMFESPRHLAKMIYKNITGTDFKFTRFMKWQQVEIFPEFYDRTIDDSLSMSYFNFINRKMKVYHYFLTIGNTSQNIEDVVVDFETGIPLLMFSGLGINVDPATRRPAPFPDALKKYFTPEKCEKRIKIEKSIKHQCQKVFDCTPAGGLHHTWKCVISVLHIDKNNHANQAVFINICYDCLGDAFVKSVFGQTGPLLDYDIRRMSILYLTELSLGDAVETTVWKDDLDSLVYKFHIKKGSVISCQAEIELYQCSFHVKSNL